MGVCSSWVAFSLSCLCFSVSLVSGRQARGQERDRVSQIRPETEDIGEDEYEIDLSDQGDRGQAFKEESKG